MNYCTLNGVKSTTIKGLLISSLPPVSKPLIRTEIEQIDGRDGDIVTKLGYSAYDKEMTIGLFGDYNVDDVISFFDSEGIVTFSNEPDKYYHYQIIDQIDFERLIRFRTATVKFHVQPFKYSAVDKPAILDKQLILFAEYSVTSNGVTLSTSNGQIKISGNATAATEIYMPVNAVEIEAGTYTLSAYAQGSSAESCSIRLIKDSPSAANSFGGTYITLSGGETETITETLEAAASFNYLWFYITPGAIDITIGVSLANDSVSSVTVRNSGNTVAKPIITLSGSGTIELIINGEPVMSVALGAVESITLNAGQMEAYYDGLLKNRLCTGDFDNLVLKVGTNVITWSGYLSSMEVTQYSRWI